MATSRAQWHMAERYASIISIHLSAVKIQKLELERILVALPLRLRDDSPKPRPKASERQSDSPSGGLEA